jgi:hypothetical protein
MFRPIWPSSGIRICQMGKLLLSVVTAITYVGPSDVSFLTTHSEERSRQKHNALTTTHVHIRGTYTYNSSNNRKQQFPHLTYSNT